MAREAFMIFFPKRMFIIFYFLIGSLSFSAPLPFAGDLWASSFKDALQKRVDGRKTQEEKQKQLEEQKRKEAQAQKKQAQMSQCALIKKALYNYFEVWNSISAELGTKLEFIIGDPARDDNPPVDIDTFLADKNGECAFHFIDNTLWDRHTSRKAFFNFNQRYISIYTTWYNPNVTLPEIKTDAIDFYNARFVTATTLSDLLDSGKLMEFKEDVKKHLLNNL
jgi:hypothetical protein